MIKPNEVRELARKASNRITEGRIGRDVFALDKFLTDLINEAIEKDREPDQDKVSVVNGEPA